MTVNNITFATKKPPNWSMKRHRPESQCTHSAFSCTAKRSWVGGWGPQFRLWRPWINTGHLLPYFWPRTQKHFTAWCLSLCLLRKYNEMQLRHKDKIRRAKETFIHEVKQRDSRIKQLENELSESKLQVEKVREDTKGFSCKGRQGSRLQCVCRSVPFSK